MMKMSKGRLSDIFFMESFISRDKFCSRFVLFYVCKRFYKPNDKNLLSVLQKPNEFEVLIEIPTLSQLWGYGLFPWKITIAKLQFQIATYTVFRL